MARRFFINESDINDDYVTITGSEHLHLSKVLRCKIGDNITVGTINGLVLECCIKEINKNKTIAQIEHKILMAKPNYNITLFQAIIKGERMEWAVEKCTELGVTNIVPFTSSFTTVKASDNKQAKLNRLAIEACKQCGRIFPPHIENVISFNECLNQLKSFSQIFLAYENENSSAKDVIKGLNINENIALIVGSEGGFSSEEVEKFKNLGAKCLSLGKNILRAETSAVALSSVIMYELNLWKKDF